MPKTRQEWQEAVDIADALQHFDSARAYGLVQGGPAFDHARVNRVLREGKLRGIKPSAGNVERFMESLVADAGAEEEAPSVELPPGSPRLVMVG